MQLESVPSKGKTKLQALVPQELFNDFEDAVEELDTDKSKLLEKLLRPALDPNTIHAKLSDESLKKLKWLAKQNHRTIELQAASLLEEALMSIASDNTED